MLIMDVNLLEMGRVGVMLSHGDICVILTTVENKVIMGSGIVTLLLFHGLCETSNHSASSSSAYEKKGATFRLYCLSLLGGSRC